MNAESPFAPEHEPDPQPSSRVYCVPRRYDLATLMAVCLAFACLFGVLRALGTPPSVMALIGGFLATVGIAQAVLFGGKNPRAASMLAGIAFPMVVGSVMQILLGYPYLIAGWIIGTVLWGSVLGYLAGAVVGGVFLIADSLRIFTKRL